LTWDGSDWTEQFPSRSPPPEGLHGMAYDATRHEVVLFGGFGECCVFDHTGTWAGTTWTNEHPMHSPPARLDEGMAYDAARRQVVIFGGSGAFGDLLGDTWTWDGEDWTGR